MSSSAPPWPRCAFEMGQRVCTCCLKREVEYQELPRMIDTQRAPQPNPTTGLVAGVCVVCRDVAANTMCLPCGHLLICYRCSLRYALPDGSLHPDVRCPNCKVAVKSFQRVFLQTASTMTRCSHTPAWWSHVGDRKILKSFAPGRPLTYTVSIVSTAVRKPFNSKNLEDLYALLS